MTAVNTVNTSIVETLMSDAGMAHEEAVKTYHAIVFNPKRNTAADRAALAGAMKTLGKTHQDALNDQAAVLKGNELAATAGGRAEAEKAIEAADADWKAWQVTKAAKLKEIEETEHKLRYASGDRRERLNVALRALHELRRHRVQFQHLANELPKEPENSPTEIRINGRWIDPGLALNQQRI